MNQHKSIDIINNFIIKRLKHNKNIICEAVHDEFGIDRDSLVVREKINRPCVFAVYNNKLKFIYKPDIIECFNRYNKLDLNTDMQRVFRSHEIIDQWKKSINTSLFPNIVDETDSLLVVEYLHGDNIRELTIKDLNTINTNYKKFNDYFNQIKNNILCINDFNIDNFVIDINTSEIYMVDVSDIDYTSMFLPDIFFTTTGDTNTPAGKFTFYQCNKIESREQDYNKLLYEYYGDMNFSAEEITINKF